MSASSSITKMRKAISSFPLPFTYQYFGGKTYSSIKMVSLLSLTCLVNRSRGIPDSIHQFYRLLEDGNLDASGPVYAKYPIKITKELRVLDQYDYRLVAPFDLKGSTNSREVQRANKLGIFLTALWKEWNRM